MTSKEVASSLINRQITPAEKCKPKNDAKISRLATI